MIEQIGTIISTTVPMPERRSERCQELVTAALAITDDLLGQLDGNG
jgi:hypothetical protein